MSDTTKEFSGWAILELMGHRRLGGYVQIVQMAGVPWFRIDILDGEGVLATQFFNPTSLYGLTPCSEQIAKLAARGAPMPLTEWELRAIEARSERPARGSLDHDGDDTQAPHDDDDEETGW